MSASMARRMLSFCKFRYFSRQFGRPSLSCKYGTVVKDLISKEVNLEQLPVTAKGWLKHVRKQKQYIFCSLVDGSCQEHLQVVAASDICPKDLSQNCSVEVEGYLVKSPKKGQSVELQANKLKMIGPCDMEEFPLSQKVNYTLDHVRTFPHLRAKTTFHQELLRVRAAASMAVHKYFQDSGFLFVHTPILTSNDCEGAGEMFHVKTTEELNKAPGSTESGSFFDTSAFLTVSGQLHLEVITGAFRKAYNFGPTFRAEKSPGRHHLAEFYMIEAEVAFTQSLECILQVMEELVTTTTKTVLDQHENSLNYLWSKSDVKDQQHIVNTLLNTPFHRMSYTEAIEVLQQSKRPFQFYPKWGCDLAKEHERYLVEYCGNSPVFVTDFPRVIKPFYARVNDSGDTVSAVDLLVPGVGELFGGSLREERHDQLKSTLDHLKLSHHYQWYLDLRRYGGVSHGGFGMGFERYLQCLLGISNIKDTIPFPRWVHQCSL